jgi:uncharacterized Zn finger protein
MATSACPTCQNTTFEMVTATPAHALFTILFVQCVQCGAVVGTMTCNDAGVLADSIQHQVADVKQKIDQIENQLDRIHRHFGIR